MTQYRISRNSQGEFGLVLDVARDVVPSDERFQVVLSRDGRTISSRCLCGTTHKIRVHDLLLLLATLHLELDGLAPSVVPLRELLGKEVP